MNKFEEIFRRYDTDKVNGWQYQDAYEDSFGSIRNDVKLIFEIGVYHGGSLRGFAEYFPNAIIVGIDIDPSTLFSDGRITVEIGDATKKEFIESLIAKYGNPDIVIDDGSHLSDDIKDSFDLLYPIVKKCYVIEDLITQYHEFFNGSYINDKIPATSIIYNKIDKLLLLRESCKSIRLYHSIAFIFKNQYI